MIRKTVFTVIVATAFTASAVFAQTPPDPGAIPLPERLSDAQKQSIRVKLDESEANLASTQERLQGVDDPMLAEFLDISRQYVTLMRGMLLGEGPASQADPEQVDQTVLKLMKRTLVRMDAFEESLQSQPHFALIAPQVRALRDRIVQARQQVFARMALRDAPALLSPDVDAIYERTQAHIDRAREAIAGAPNEAALRQRLDTAQAQLDEARRNMPQTPAKD